MPPKPDQIHGDGQSQWPALLEAGAASERRKPQDGESRTQAQTRLLLGQRKGVWAALWGSWAVILSLVGLRKLQWIWAGGFLFPESLSP